MVGEGMDWHDAPWRSGDGLDAALDLRYRVKSDKQPGLRLAHVDLIQETWKVVSTLPAETVGVLLFKHIFEEAPLAAGLFSFGKEPGFDPTADHSQNPAVVKHGANVVKTVGVAVGMLKDLDNLVPVLKDLGKRHTKYGVVAAHFPIVGAAFLKTLEVGLGPAYTPEVAHAFTEMWSVVESVMLSGMEA